MNLIARTTPPAKLNLFLEIPFKRDDGFHEIDTVMVAIGLRDELEVKLSADPKVQLACGWLPSDAARAAELGLDCSVGELPDLLKLPLDQSNLVVKALIAFRDEFGIDSGFEVLLNKRIPAGAGMGGASSDAAHALSCAAYLHQIPISDSRIKRIASSIGSDVPFFLEYTGDESDPSDFNGPPSAARATGRGEILTPLKSCPTLDLVVAYPNASLSTADVYRGLKVSNTPIDSSGFIEAFQRGDRDAMSRTMMNRLTEPALKILARSGELIESLWQSGLQTCQLTGSGSACFGLAQSAEQAQDVVKRLKVKLQPGVMLRAVQTVPAAAPIEIETI